jgi:hypothetical protein
MDELKRKDTKRLAVEREIKILQAAAANEISPEIPEKAFIKNLSGGGLCIVSGIRIKKGTVIEADVMLRTEGLEKFRAYIMAVWSRESEETGCFETGAQFLGMKQEDATVLERYIKQHLN